jgi:hypothetical protein
MSKQHDDEPFTADELMAMQAGHLFNQAQQHADDDRVHYERVPIKGAIPQGGFRLPLDVLNRLSREHGPRETGVMLKKLFDVDPDNPQNIPAHAVAAHGGHKVLERFVRRLRSGRARSQTISQPDNHHGRVVKVNA